MHIKYFKQIYFCCDCKLFRNKNLQVIYEVFSAIAITVAAIDFGNSPHKSACSMRCAIFLCLNLFYIFFSLHFYFY